MSAHTPGPWRAVAAASQMADPGTTIGRLQPTGNEGAFWWLFADADAGNAEANARLIEAAPRLLAALEGLHWACSGIAYIQEEYAEQVEAARAAIEAATGGAE